MTLVTLPVYFSVSWPTAGYQPQEVDAVNLLGYAVRIRPDAGALHLRLRRRHDLRAHRRRRAAATPTATSPGPMPRPARTRRTSTSPTAESSASTAARGPGSPTPSPFPARRRPSPCGRRSRVSSAADRRAAEASLCRRSLRHNNDFATLWTTAATHHAPFLGSRHHDDRPGGNHAVTGPASRIDPLRRRRRRPDRNRRPPAHPVRPSCRRDRRLARPRHSTPSAPSHPATSSTPWPSAGAAGPAWCRTPSRRCTPSRRRPERRPAATPASRAGSPPPRRCADMTASPT